MTKDVVGAVATNQPVRYVENMVIQLLSVKIGLIRSSYVPLSKTMEDNH